MFQADLSSRLNKGFLQEVWFSYYLCIQEKNWINAAVVQPEKDFYITRMPLSLFMLQNVSTTKKAGKKLFCIMCDGTEWYQ